MKKEIYTGLNNLVPTRREEEESHGRPIHYLRPEHNGNGNGSKSDVDSQIEVTSESHDIGEIARIAYEFYGKHCGLPELDIQRQANRLCASPEAVEHVVFMLGELNPEKKPKA